MEQIGVITKAGMEDLARSRYRSEGPVAPQNNPKGKPKVKWFKHFTNANADDKLVTTRSLYGMWGIGAFWTLLELTAAQMKKENPWPKATLSVPELCSFFGCKRNKLVSFLKHSRNVLEIKWKLNQDILEIEIPKLLKIKDNYLTDLEETSKKLPSREVEVEVEEEVDKKSTSNGDFLGDGKTPEALQVSAAVDAWNAFATEHGLPAVKKLTDTRRRQTLARLKDPDFKLDEVLQKATESDFLLGKVNDFKMTFDFIFGRTQRWLEILEGKYSSGKAKPKAKKLDPQEPPWK